MPRPRLFHSSIVVAALGLLAACSHRGSADGAPASSLDTAPASPASAEPPPIVPEVVAPGAVKPVHPGSGAIASARAAPPALPVDPGADLIEPARELFRVAACGEAGDVPARFDSHVVDAHCKSLKALYARYRTRWLDVAEPFIAGLRPQGLPGKVVYPFGGGDLVTALAVFPDAEEITTMSLEPPGDVRRIDAILPIRLKGAFTVIDHNIMKLLGMSYSNTINLGRGDRAWLPGEIVLHLAALVVHGYEPTSLRYFKFNPDGTLHYLSADEIEAEGNLEHPEPEGGRAPFANVELHFKKAGSTGSDKVLRQIAHDLANREVGLDPGLRKYLESRGQVAVMTKAASHLLWADDFSTIRDYLLEHAEWMISDSTGVPPRFASAAGFVQDTYGIFDGPAPFGPIEPLDGHAFRRLFAENPKKHLPFKFGYGDVHHRSHLVVMRKADASAKTSADAASK
ncbi:MAG TPA: hypothetical protein VH062_34620 [Polyangiaceae bacterium]|jgi:hypothetical protein|nr:hypothetical protein [Polyangiaceae bacterium]